MAGARRFVEIEGRRGAGREEGAAPLIKSLIDGGERGDGDNADSFWVVPKKLIFLLTNFPIGIDCPSLKHFFPGCPDNILVTSLGYPQIRS